MKKTITLSISLFYVLLTYGQTSTTCYTDANKLFLKNELKSLTNIYKDVLNDCNSNQPSASSVDCENDLQNLKSNIEQLTALNSLVESLGCNFSIYRDDKPCITGKYCHSYKIEDKSEFSNTPSKTSDDVKNEYNLELARIKSQERQEFFEMVYKIIGLFLDNADNSGLLDEIRKMISGEENASRTYNISDKNRTAIDNNNDGKIEGYKTVNPDGSTTFALDTDNDGIADELITYDKSGKVVAEKTVPKSTTTPKKKSTKAKPKAKPNPPSDESLWITWAGVIDNGEGDDWPHGPSGNMHVLIFNEFYGCPGDRKSYSGFLKETILSGPSSGDAWFDLEDVGATKIWDKLGSGDYKNEFLDGDAIIVKNDKDKDKPFYKWKAGEENIILFIYESDPGGIGRSHDAMLCVRISRKDTRLKEKMLYDKGLQAHDDAINNCKKRGIKWYTHVWKSGLKKGIPRMFIKVITK